MITELTIWRLSMSQFNLALSLIFPFFFVTSLFSYHSIKPTLSWKNLFSSTSILHKKYSSAILELWYFLKHFKWTVFLFIFLEFTKTPFIKCHWKKIACSRIVTRSLFCFVTYAVYYKIVNLAIIQLHVDCY